MLQMSYFIALNFKHRIYFNSLFVEHDVTHDGVLHCLFLWDLTQFFVKICWTSTD